MNMERVPKRYNFHLPTNLNEVRLRFFLQAETDPKSSEWFGPYQFVADEPTVVEKGEWLEIDTALRVCHLCAELDGVTVSRTIPGKWEEA